MLGDTRNLDKFFLLFLRNICDHEFQCWQKAQSALLNHWTNDQGRNTFCLITVPTSQLGPFEAQSPSSVLYQLLPALLAAFLPDAIGFEDAVWAQAFSNGNVWHLETMLKREERIQQGMHKKNNWYCGRARFTPLGFLYSSVFMQRYQHIFEDILPSIYSPHHLIFPLN